MTEQLEWYEAQPQPKILNRQPGYWLCILGCGKDTCRGKGDTPEEAIYDASQEQEKRPVDRNRPALPREVPKIEEATPEPEPKPLTFLDDYAGCAREDWRNRI